MIAQVRHLATLAELPNVSTDALLEVVKAQAEWIERLVEEVEALRRKVDNAERREGFSPGGVPEDYMSDGPWSGV